MRVKLLIPFLLLYSSFTAGAYTDHRGHNVDSLETVMAQWTVSSLESASASELESVAKNLEGLLYGFSQTNSVKSEYYARMLLRISQLNGWPDYECVAAKNIGSHFWAREVYDSAATYYRVALDAANGMQIGSTYNQEDKDDALSQIYGSLGNLYSMMDSVDLAMDFYEKAGELFAKHDWHNSNSTLYYNMGETMRYEGEYKRAEKYYRQSMDYSLLADDSLAVATACKGLGSLYMETGRTAKAMRYLKYANVYFAGHEAEELQFRMESLDYTQQVLASQKKRMWAAIALLAALLLASGVIIVVSKLFKRGHSGRESLSEVQDDPSHDNDIVLSRREREVIDLIAKGYTNTQIADALCLSPETIKWYKKKLFSLFEASNSAELVRIATEKKLVRSE